MRRVERVEVPCAACGKAIPKRPSDIARIKTGRHFCSSECLRKVGTKPTTSVVIDCEMCGKPIHRRQHQIKRGTGRFCSKDCHNAAQRGPRLAFKCEGCGSVFELVPSQAAHQTGRFCSKTCEGISRIERPLDCEHNGKPARLDRHGYVWVWEPDHPEARRYKGWVAEHRLVAEQVVGRPLTSDDEVHHINRIKHDNCPENLLVLDGVTHAVITTQQRQTDKELLAEYVRRFGPLD